MKTHRFKTKSKVSTEYFSDEDHTQYQVVAYVNIQYPHVLFFHPKNEGHGKISYNQMQRIKALGVQRGVPDLLFFDHRNRFAGLAIEIKTPKGSVTKEQRNWLCNLKTRNWLTCVVRSFDECKQIIDDYYKND